MQVKGTSLIATKKFVYQKFGQDGLERFVNALPPATKAMMTEGLLANNWYPAGPGIFVPTEEVCRMFFDGDPQGAWEIGSFSAHDALRGIYRFFIRIASIDFLLQKTSSVFVTYYTPGRMEVADRGEHRILLRMTEVDESNPLFETRISGWLHGALQICGNENHTVRVGASLTRGDDATEFIVDLA